MRLSSLVWGLLLGAVAHVAAQEEDDEEIPADYSQEYTKFDGKTVPPILELTPDTFEKEIKASKYMLIKHYSPYCPHCQDFAPNFRTLYEFYYTEEMPDPSTTFTEYYDWRFATINCIAFYDLCAKNGVSSYPMTILFENGEKKDGWKGVKSIQFLSDQIEPVLESARPGSRPKTVLTPQGAGAPAAPAAAGAAAGAGAGAAPAVEELAALRPQEPKADAVKAAPPAPAKAQPAKPTKTPEPEWRVRVSDRGKLSDIGDHDAGTVLAKEMQGKLNVGEVNCEANKRLCKDARLRGYPTILFFRGGERVEYDGLRGIGDFVHYAESAVDLSTGVQEVDAESLEALEAREEVIFIYFYDHATTSEDFMALERLPLSLIGKAKLVKTKDPKLYERYKITTWPRLLVSREGRPTYYTPLTPNEMRDTRQVLTWMKSVWLPIVPELTASNAREIMDGKIVVLGIINRQDQESFSSAIREMKSAASEWMDKQIQLFQLERQELRDAKQLRIEEAEDRGDQRALRAAKLIHVNMDRADRKEVAFAWVDGVFWQRWIKTTYGIDIKDGERVIINDEDNRRYWDQTSTGNYIIPSRTSILETINKVTAQPPKIKPKLTISSFEKIFFDMRVTFSEHPYLTIGCVAGLLLGSASWFRGRFGRRRGNRLFLNDEFKAPLLGSNANGKTD
ncbi:hypothetical protein OPQ81_003782 [Rhizoctonia solani]|nr:hypothetical protein OPQ81_003782 [Rhizoctonia solani]